MRRAFAAISLFSTACVVACGLELSGTSTIVPGDASALDEDAADASLDATQEDGAGPADVMTDAIADAVVDVDASTRFCLLASHRLCADFDDNTYGGATIETSTNGQVSFTTQSFAGPSSLSASVVPADSTNRARINFPALAVVANKVRFEAMFRVDSVANTGGLTYLVTVQDTDASIYGVRLAIDSNGNLGVVLTGSGAPPSTILGTIPTGWFHAVLEMSPNQVVVQIDNGAPKTFAWTATPPANAILKLGIVGANGVSSAIRIDNVALD